METQIIRTSLQSGEWVTSIDFKDSCFHTLIQSQSCKYMFSHPGSVLPVQSSPIRSVHSSHGGHGSGQGGQSDCTTKGYKDPPVPRQLVGHSQVPPNLSPAYTNSCRYMSGVRLVGQNGGVRSGSQTSLQIRRLPVRSERRQDQTHPKHWQTLNTKIKKLLTGPTSPVWQLVTLIGLLTATEKQVHLGRLHSVT